LSHSKKTSDKEVSERSPTSLILKLVVIIAFPLLVVIAFYASFNVTATNGPLFPNAGGLGGVYFTSTGNISSTTFVLLNESSFQNSSFPNILPQIPESLIIILILVVFAGVSLAVVMNTRRRSIVLTTGFDVEELEKQRNEVANILDQTVTDLRRGGEYRQTVLECYGKICEILESRSKIDGRLLTAREFDAAVSDRLKLNSPYLAQITGIFEDARYSVHEISEREADAAIDCLTHLSSALRESDSIASG
jgi:hypothetical protein